MLRNLLEEDFNEEPGCGELPFGLSFNSYSRAAITAQNFKFNGGSEVEEMTDWYSTPFRKYDPALGRFHGVDALADMYTGITPSHFGMNNPVNYNDPTGLRPAPKAFDYEASDTDMVGSNLQGLDNGPSGTNDWARAGNIGSWGRGTGGLYGQAGPNAYQYAMIQAMKQLSSMISDAWQSTCNSCANTYTYDNGTLVGIYSVMLLNKISLPSSNYGSSGGNQLASLDSRGIGSGLAGIGSKPAPSLASGSGDGMKTITLDPVVVEDTRLAENIGVTNFANSNIALAVGGSLYRAMEGATASDRYWLGKNGKYYTNMTGPGPNQYTGSRIAALNSAKTYRVAGRAALAGSVVLGGYMTYEGYVADGGQFGYNAQVAAAGTVGGLAGGLAGAKAGAAIGAGIGVWVGGAGAIPGAVIGGFIGGVAGGIGGGYAGESAVNSYYGN